MIKNKLLVCMLMLAYTLAAVSCKKETGEGAATAALSAEIDGKSVSFANSLIATKVNAIGNQVLVVQGSLGTTPLTSDRLSIRIYRHKKILSGTYDYDFLTLQGPGVQYTAAVQYTEYASGALHLYDAVSGADDPVVVKITSVDAKSVQGTFAGTVKMSNLNGAASKKVIKRGQFNVGF